MEQILRGDLIVSNRHPASPEGETCLVFVDSMFSPKPQHIKSGQGVLRAYPFHRTGEGFEPSALVEHLTDNPTASAQMKPLDDFAN